MRVLYITHSIEMGGASVAIINLLAHLTKKGIYPMVTCPTEGSFSERLKEMDIPVKTIGNPLEIYPKIYSWRSYIKYPYSLLLMLLRRHSAYKKLCSCIETFHPDIIHTNVGPIHIGYFAARKYNIPHVWHIREYQKEDFNMNPFPSMKSYIDMLHNERNHCITITKDVFKHFRLNEAKDTMIYDGVIDKDKIKTFNTKKQPYILFVGRLSDAKGTKDLISAYNEYAKNGGSYNLCLAGKGDECYLKECISLLDKKNRSKVNFLGECKHSNIYQLMYDAAVFVVPSRNEGFGFITAEAMFNGAIVIGKNTGGTKEQFDNGLTLTGSEIGFRYNNDNELIELLVKSEHMANDVYKNIIVNAQNVVCELYDMQTQSEKILNFYKNIIS